MRTKLWARVVKAEGAQDLPLPSFATAGSTGMDLYADVPDGAPVEIPPGGADLISSGLYITPPPGYGFMIRCRSGLAKRRIVVEQGVGTMDWDYRGPYLVLLANNGNGTFAVTRGMRIAQLTLERVTRWRWKEVKSLSKTGRGHGGFGSTGTF